MAVHPLPQISQEEESSLVTRAREGDRAAFGSLVEPWREPLFGYIYRMVALRQDAEDLLQDVLVRVLEGIREYRGEARFKSWLFGIATHVCLDHLRHKKRWRVDAQLIGEREATADPEKVAGLRQLMAQTDFRYEIREHIAFCFSCIARTLPPEEQAALISEGGAWLHGAGSSGNSEGVGAGVSPPACSRARHDDRRLRGPVRADQQERRLPSVPRLARNRRREPSRPRFGADRSCARLGSEC